MARSREARGTRTTAILRRLVTRDRFSSGFLAPTLAQQDRTRRCTVRSVYILGVPKYMLPHSDEPSLRLTTASFSLLSPLPFAIRFIFQQSLPRFISQIFIYKLMIYAVTTATQVSFHFYIPRVSDKNGRKFIPHRKHRRLPSSSNDESSKDTFLHDSRMHVDIHTPDIDVNFFLFFLHRINKAARVATFPITFTCLHNCVFFFFFIALYAARARAALINISSLIIALKLKVIQPVAVL